MANTPIDRTNRDDLLVQIGRIETEVKELNRRQCKIDKRLKNIPREFLTLGASKCKIVQKISKKELYLNQLREDIKSISE